jgi:hypothetical protein
MDENINVARVRAIESYDLDRRARNKHRYKAIADANRPHRIAARLLGIDETNQCSNCFHRMVADTVCRFRHRGWISRSEDSRYAEGMCCHFRLGDPR